MQTANLLTGATSGSTTPGVTGAPSVTNTGNQSGSHTHQTTANTDVRAPSNGTESSPGWLWGPTGTAGQGYANIALKDLTSGSQSASHTHSLQSHTHTSAAHTHSVPSLSGSAISSGNHIHTITLASSNTSSIGTGTALDITPSFETLYVWKRTA